MHYHEYDKATKPVNHSGHGSTSSPSESRLDFHGFIDKQTLGDGKQAFDTYKHSRRMCMPFLDSPWSA